MNQETAEHVMWSSSNNTAILKKVNTNSAVVLPHFYARNWQQEQVFEIKQARFHQAGH